MEGFGRRSTPIVGRFVPSVSLIGFFLKMSSSGFEFLCYSLEECAAGGFTCAIKCASLGSNILVGDLMRSLSLFSFKEAKSSVELVRGWMDLCHSFLSLFFSSIKCYLLLLRGNTRCRATTSHCGCEAARLSTASTLLSPTTAATSECLRCILVLWSYCICVTLVSCFSIAVLFHACIVELMSSKAKLALWIPKSGRNLIG